MFKKRIGSTVVMVMIFFLLCVFASAAPTQKKIGILLWEDEKNYTDARDSFIEQMGKEGFGQNKATYIIEDAKGSRVKATEIARQFAASKLDLVVPLGTSAAVAVMNEVKDVPMVFSVIYDPVDSKLAESWESSGNNTTGTSSKVSMSQLLENLKKLAPVKSLAVLYTRGQKNSEAQLKDLQSAQEKFNIKVIPVPLTSKEEATQSMEQIVSMADAVFLSGSSVAIDVLPIIVSTAKKARVITCSVQADKVEKGILLGVYANTRTIGAMAGEKAAKVLRGAKPSSIPIETVKKADVIINMTTAKESGISVPPAFLKAASRVIE